VNIINIQSVRQKSQTNIF